MSITDRQLPEPPSPAEQVRLSRRAQAGDVDARNELIERNLRLVVWVAGKYPDVGLELDERIDEGVFGLARAIEGFDPAIGSFSTYATTSIRQSIQRAIDETGRAIRMPINREEDLRRIRKAEAAFAAAHDRIPSRDELAALANVRSADLERISRASLTPTSLNAPIGEGESEFGDLLPDDGAPLHESVVRDELRDEIEAALTGLTDGEAEVIRRAYGEDAAYWGDKLNLREVADELGITRAAVSLRHKRALAKLAAMPRLQALA